MKRNSEKIKRYVYQIIGLLFIAYSLSNTVKIIHGDLTFDSALFMVFVSMPTSFIVSALLLHPSRWAFLLAFTSFLLTFSNFLYLTHPDYQIFSLPKLFIDFLVPVTSSFHS